MGIEDVEARLFALAQDYDPLKSDTVLRTRDYQEIYDPFYGAFTQTNRMKAYCEVLVDGVDVTLKMDPHLISVRIQDGNQYTCEIELDDRDGRLPLPFLQAKVEVRIGWANERMFKMFHGVIQSIEHGFGRKQGGRRMWIHAQGWNMVSTRIKQPMDDNLGAGAKSGEKEGPKKGLDEWVQQIIKNAGGTVEINPFFKKYKQDYWGMMSASPLHQITEEAKKFGAMVQWSAGNKLDWEIPAQRGLTCRAVWRDNLIGWKLHPFTARNAYKGPMASFFNNKTGEWVKKMMDNVAGTTGPGAAAVAQTGAAGPAASETAAGNATQGGKDADEPGFGRIVINGEPAAQFNSLVSLEGARPGVDGVYLICVAEHIYSRQGYVTWLDVIPYKKAVGPSNVFDSWPLPRPNPNTTEGLAVPPPAVKKTQEELDAERKKQEEERAAADLAAREAARVVLAEQMAAADEAFIQSRADSPFIPGRAPFDPGGYFGRAVNDRDKRAYRRWYEQRNQPVPPEWQ
jgi:hypothetical protein